MRCCPEPLATPRRCAAWLGALLLLGSCTPPAPVEPTPPPEKPTPAPSAEATPAPAEEKVEELVLLEPRDLAELPDETEMLPTVEPREDSAVIAMPPAGDP